MVADMRWRITIKDDRYEMKNNNKRWQIWDEE
jgi:hypothetical protein